MNPAPSPIDWDRAERVALSIAARRRPISPSAAAPAPELAPTAVIEDAIHEVTGLRPPHGPAQVQFVDRPAWIRANIQSFRTLLAPLLDRWSEKPVGGKGAAANIARQVAGAEVGAMLGWMSTRVLGQYDILVGRRASDDAVYLVAPNLTDIEQRYGFDPAEFRTWVLLHELTHRAQFTGVPWMRDHFTGLIDTSLSFADPDPAALVGALRDALRNRRDAAVQVRDGGVLGLVASPEQRAVMARIGGLMSLLEGHGDITMTRAAGPLVPNAERFERILRERRRNTNPLSRTVMRLTGVEAKLNQYAAGVRFITAIETEAGERAVDRCWTSPDHLPTLEEVRVPAMWLARTGATVG
ncbi:MAG: zinc-dependent metalloprotease [Actinobacteria bacterium]|nr:zinc-dependent metalloprotease [Actinomycetota bacterium]